MMTYLIRIIYTFHLLIITFYAQGQDSLKLHLPFSSTPLDVSGNFNDAVIFGATLTFDRFNQANSAYNFDGQVSYLMIPHSPNLNFNVSDEFTISLWLYPRSFNFRSEIFSKWIDEPGGNNSNYPYSIRLENQIPNVNKARVLRYDKFCAGIPFSYSNNPVMINNWNHLVFRKLGDSLSIFLNGNKDEVFYDFSQCNTTNNDPIFIGRRGGSANADYYDGIIDDIKLFNTGLSDALIDSLFNEDPIVNSIEGNYLRENLSILPNPAKDKISLKASSGNNVVKIIFYNSLGKIVVEESENTQEVLLNNFPSGTYFLKIYTDQGLINRKLIID